MQRDQDSLTPRSWGVIAVGVRIGNAPAAAFHRSLTRAISGHMRKGDVLLDPPVGFAHHAAANLIVRQFLDGTACDTLLMLDDDIVFEPDAIARLRGDPIGQGYDVLASPYVCRRAPFAPIVLRRDPDGPGYIVAKSAITGYAESMDVVGLGFTLIRRTVLEAMLDTDRNVFSWGPTGQGEDAWFCERAIAAGFRIGAHTGLFVGHRTAVTIEWDHASKKTVIKCDTPPGYEPVPAVAEGSKP